MRQKLHRELIITEEIDSRCVTIGKFTLSSLEGKKNSAMITLHDFVKWPL